MKENKKQLKRIKLINIVEKIAKKFPFIYLLKNHPKPHYFYHVLKDYIFLKKNFSFLKNDFKKNKNNKIIITSLTNSIYQVKIEAMVAKILQLFGCEVIVITWSFFCWPKKYFKLFGINKIIYFDRFLSSFKKYNYEKEINKLIDEGLRFQEVKKWNFKGCRVGQQVLSKMGRRMHGTPNLKNKIIFDIFIYQLNKQIKNINAARELLNNINPDKIFFMEANDFIYGAFFDTAFNKDVDIIQLVQPFRDDALIFKRFNKESKGLHPNSLSKSNLEKLKFMDWDDEKENLLMQEFSNRYKGKWFLSSRNQINTKENNREEILIKLGLDKNKKIAVVFSHVLWDANLFYGDDLFEDYEEWFIETVKAACKNSNINWLIKLHPANVWKRNRDNISGKLREEVIINEKIGVLPENVKLLYPDSDISTLSLFKYIDYGITVRGTTGMELPCFGKPILTAGTGRYSGLGFTVDSKTKEEYLNKISNLHNLKSFDEKTTKLAKIHAYSVFCLRPWPIQGFKASFNYKQKGTHPLDQNLLPTIKSLEEFKNFPYVKSLSKWILNSNNSDYFNKDINICVE